MRVARILGCALALVGCSLVAEDFSKLMQVVHQSWPDKSHIGVICDYAFSRDAVQKLADSAGPGSYITVMDTRHIDYCARAAIGLSNRNINYMVLIPTDRIAWDGSYGATVGVRMLARKGVPSIGTTNKAVKQGAVFAVGDGTNGEIIVTKELIGTVEVVLPDRYTLLERISLFDKKSADVIVVSQF